MNPIPDREPVRPRWPHFKPDSRYSGRVCSALGGAIPVFPGEPIDNALRRLKKHLAIENIPHEVRRRERFIPKTKVRRYKAYIARKRAQG